MATRAMTAADRQYVCPRETHAISHSVHLARMAAYYPKCRDCPFREETGQLAPTLPPRKSSDVNGSKSRSLFTPEGVRGRHLNELDRATVANITAAFASLLWDKASLPARPTVVVGYDQRPSSPDLVAGVTAALRQMGCAIVDIGPATSPLLAMAAHDLQTDGGLLVNGAGCDPGWTGLDFFGPDGLLIGNHNEPDSEISLTAIETRMKSPINRPTRSAGSFRAVRNWDRYEAGIREEFHALRPLHVIVGVATPILGRIVRNLFESLPCGLTVVPLPVRARSVTDRDDADVERIAVAVRDTTADLGFLIDDCGQRCGVIDETGRLISPAALSPLLDGVIETVASGRYWFQREIPTCDAFLTMAATLSALSHSDAGLSDVIAGSAIAA